MKNENNLYQDESNYSELDSKEELIIWYGTDDVDELIEKYLEGKEDW